MNDQTMEKPEGAPTAAPASNEPPSAEADAERRESEFVAAMEAARAEVSDLKDRLLRANAEMENLRRRQQRELAEGRQYAITGFAGDLLGIGDNLSRALSAVPQEARGDAAISSLVQGVEMTDREFHRLLEKHGVKKFSPKGEKFDPHRQQAMFEVEDASAPPGTVVQVIQAGYSIGDRVLRAALVGIAKAPAAKPAEEPPVSSEAAPTAPEEGS